MTLKYLLDENVDKVYRRQLILNNVFSISQAINELALIAEASFDDEYQDQIIYLPLSQYQ